MKNTKERLVDFFGTRINVTTQDQEINDIDELIHTDASNYVVYANVHMVVTSKKNEALKDAIDQAAIASPDGMPLVMLAKWRKAEHMEHCAGPDMILKVIEYGLDKGYRHYFYGSTDETLALLQKNLIEKYPEINIVGAYSPPFRPLTDEENNMVVNEINELQPDCIWVGLGAPKQEIWMKEHQNHIKKGVMFGVGAAFDFHAGVLDRAPKWMQDDSLEWLYRLVKEPKRLWKRYLVTNTLFIWYAIRYGVRLINYAAVDGLGNLGGSTRRQA